jgi:hypothetical protein
MLISYDRDPCLRQVVLMSAKTVREVQRLIHAWLNGAESTALSCLPPSGFLPASETISIRVRDAVLPTALGICIAFNSFGLVQANPFGKSLSAMMLIAFSALLFFAIKAILKCRHLMRQLVNFDGGSSLI